MYFPSLSGKTFVYKGILTTPQLRGSTSTCGMIASNRPWVWCIRGSPTNTFPSWPLAHPFRRVAHNGEINTVTGNENWMRAREALIDTSAFGKDAADAGAQRAAGSDGREDLPRVHPGASDTAHFDEVLELLHLGGRSLPHAVLMMIPGGNVHETMK